MMKIITGLMKIWPKRWISTALVVLVILYLTLVPRPLPDNNIEIPGLDKAVHAVMFGGLAFVACIDMAMRGRRRYGLLTSRMVWGVAIAVATFGGAVEIAQQSMGAGRSGDVWDFAADCAGVAVGILSAMWALRVWHKQNRGASR